MTAGASYEQTRAQRKNPRPAPPGGDDRFSAVVEKVQRNLAHVMHKIEALDRSIKARVG